MGGARGQSRQASHAEISPHQSPHSADGGGRGASVDVEAAAEGEGRRLDVPNRIKNAGTKMKPGPMWHEDLLGRVIQPVAEKLGLPHVTWRLLRHWGATEMVEAKVPIKAAQERLGSLSPRCSSQVLRSCPRRFGGRGGGNAQPGPRRKVGGFGGRVSGCFVRSYRSIGSQSSSQPENLWS